MDAIVPLCEPLLQRVDRGRSESIAATKRAMSASSVRTIVLATCAPRFLKPASSAIREAVLDPALAR